ncbi:ATP-dependent helicase [Fusobacterium sp. PH5-44]|uniref:ATP-dependent helicase n=1 Tax=unclassified Fusobacterium TaxID=2648384 RepID=UPI003D20130B
MSNIIKNIFFSFLSKVFLKEKINEKDKIKFKRKNLIVNRAVDKEKANKKNAILQSIKRLEMNEITDYNRKILQNKKINYENLLSEEQKRALTSINGQFLVIAGAGSGKTRTIVYRTSLLLELGVKPEEILMITFTRKAALEMKKRVEELLEMKMKTLDISTFHSFCARQIINQKDYFNVDKLKIFEEKAKLIKIKELSMKYNIKKIKKIPFPSVKRFCSLFDYERLYDGSILEVLNEKEKFYSDEILQVRNAFFAYKKEMHIFEFDDLLNIFINGLEKNENFKKIIQDRYKYIIVDEYQDSNLQQRRLLNNLVGDNGNLMVVGDDYQSIYGFRGANFENILRFSDDFSKSKLIKLETNYRSTNEIIAYSNRISSKFLISYSKIAKGIGKKGSKPQIFSFKTKEKEAIYVVKKIKELLDLGISSGEIAILFRNRFVIIHILKELKKNNIPFYLKENDEGEKETEMADGIERVSIISVHSSKGLEWEYVFIPVLLEGIFPAENNEKILEEEKRLYYVGCSRAKKLLFLTYPEFFYEKIGYFCNKSRFLDY